MDASWAQLLASVIRLGRHLRQIKDEVSNLPEELILIHKPVEKSSVISIRGC